MKKITLLLALIAALTSVMAQKPIKPVAAGANGTGTVTWDKDTIYNIQGFVYVNPGDVLTIQPGTTVVADTGSGANATALIVSRGGKIIADGTKDEPIVFTSILDDLADPFDLDEKGGLWGGLVVLGNGQLNTVPGEKAIEGIPAGDPRSNYGALPAGTTNDADSSGVIRYVSIRYSGTSLGTGSEIQGLTLGGVGSKTLIDYVEIIYCTDDGIEWFGGTVGVKHAVIAFVDDDCYDYDQGWRGKGQFWFAIQKASVGADRGGEWDGADSPELGTPFGIPTIYNYTFLGLGSGSNRTITFRANGGGKVYNSVFADQGRGVDVELKGNSDDSYTRFEARDLDMQKNIFWNIANNVPRSVFTISPIAGTFAGVDSATIVSAANTALKDYMTANNDVMDPQFVSISRAEDSKALDPRVRSFKALSDLYPYPSSDPFFTPVTFKGAFALDSLWMKGWTHLDERGYLPEPANAVTSVEKNEIATLKLFPNPNNGSFSITASDLAANGVNISVYTVSGQLVQNNTVATVAGQLDTEINLGNQPAGVYFVNVTQGEKTSTIRVIVK
jgi:hypothetical protein